MKLQTITIENYRSITSAKKINLGQMSILIGPNNEGKSNILRALVLAMNILTRDTRNHFWSRFSREMYSRRTYYREEIYVWEKDFPVSKRDKGMDSKTTIVLEFEIGEDERKEFTEKIKSKITSPLPLKLEIGKDNRPKITFNKPGKGTRGLSKKSSKIAEFVADKIEFVYIPTIRTAESVQEIVDELVSRAFFMLEKNKEYKKALNSIEKLQEPILDRFRQDIKQTLQRFIPQVRKVDIQLSPLSRYLGLFREVSVSVDDGTMTPLEYKGDGAQSLAALAMIRHSSVRGMQEKNLVIAIEEPESHLHPDAIHGLREVIYDLGQEHQVIIASHNPLFVDRENLSNNIIVNRGKAQPAKNIKEVRKILGVRVMDNLRSAEMALVVEGKSDARFLREIIKARSLYLKKSLQNGSFGFYLLRGKGNLLHSLQQLQNQLCRYHVFLDYEQDSVKYCEEAKKEGLLKDSQCHFARMSGKDPSELEDLIDLGVYKSAVEEKHGVQFRGKFSGKEKWSQRIEQVFIKSGREWNGKLKSEVKNFVLKKAIKQPENAISEQAEGVINTLIQVVENEMKREEN